MLSKARHSQIKRLLFAIIFCFAGVGAYSGVTLSQGQCYHCGGEGVGGGIAGGCGYDSSLQCGWGDCEHSVWGSGGECEVFGGYGACGDPDDCQEDQEN